MLSLCANAALDYDTVQLFHIVQTVRIIFVSIFVNETLFKIASTSAYVSVGTVNFVGMDSNHSRCHFC